ncbi:MAG: thioredoxin domain-containing protein, partial [Patescibacteria group bacterium]
MKNNTQPIIIGLSFLVIGLVVGLLISSKGTTFIANFIEEDGSAQGPEEIVDQVIKEGRQVVSIDDDSVLGSPDAPITIVEFSDYQCPYCNSFWSETFPQIKTNYIDTGKVKFVYRDYPLPSHPQAQLAAEAAECAAKDNSALYYQMHDKLFGGISEWHLKDTAKDTFIAYGNELGVDISACLNNGE